MKRPPALRYDVLDMPPLNPVRVQTMFERIVPRYDLLNRLMSLGMDRRWRRLAAAAVQPRSSFALDIGTGTGDMAMELRRRGAARIVAVDFSNAMLSVAGRKTAGAAAISFAQADALRLPFGDATFDVITNAFLLRNLADLPAGLSEMARVLRPGGRLASLDMTQPPRSLFGTAYHVYFNHLVPVVAGALSGDAAAYRYLPRSLRGFPDATALKALLVDAGFADVRVRLLSSGTIALHTAAKPA